MQLEYRPNEADERIILQADGVVGATAEGLCTLVSYVDWLRHHAHQAPSILITGGNSLETLGLTPELTVAPTPIHDAVTAKSHILPPTEVRIPRVRSLANDPVAASDRAFLQRTADEAADSIFAACRDLADSSSHRTAVREFLWEALLNVYEHAYQGETTNENPPRAWAAATICDAQRAALLFSPPHSYRQEIESHWLRSELPESTDRLFELTVVDSGLGVINTLGGAYLRAHPDAKQKLNQRSVRAWIPLHDSILNWALSPFGSRKLLWEHRSTALAESWRGLYRLLHRTTTLSGALTMRSGLGTFGVASVAKQPRLYPGSAMPPYGHEPKSWLGTTLTLRLALPPRTATTFSVNSVSTTVLAAASSVERVRTPSIRSSSYYLPLSGSPEHAVYLANVHEALRSALAKLPQPCSPVVFSRIALIVHPALRLPPIRALHAPMAPTADARVTEVDAEYEQAAEMLSLLRHCSIPGLVPVHLFLEATPGATQLAQQMFAKHARESTPALFGLTSTHDGRIHWFLRSCDAIDLAVLSVDHQLEIPGNLPGDRSLELDHLYPGALEITDSHSGVTIQLRLPDRISPQLVADQVQATLRTLTEHHETRWFWRQSRPEDDEFVQTTSGQLATQFLSPYALCEDEPILASILSWLLSQFIGTLTRQTSTIFIVPDSENSSYLLAKRLFQRNIYGGNVRVVHPGDVERDLLPSDRVLLFADATYGGKRLMQRLETLEKCVTVTHVLVCFDFRPERQGFLNFDERKFVAVRWPFPAPVVRFDPPARVYTVDSLTNERLPTGTVAESHAYRELVWRGPPPRCDPSVRHSEQEVILQDRRFRYGLQEITGRLHVVRCSSEALLQDKEAFPLLTKWLCQAILAVEQPSADVVLFARDEGIIWQHLPRLARELGPALSAHFPIRPRNSLEDTSRIFYAPVPTTRRGNRQFIVQRMGRSLLDAIVLAAEGPRYETPPSKGPYSTQLRLFEEHLTPDLRLSHKSTEQLNLFGVASGERPVGFKQPARSSHEHLRPGFVAVYIDSAAVSGRSARDFVVSIAEQRTLPPSAIVVACVVNKLSPSEERLLHQIRSLHSANIEPSGQDPTSATAADRGIPFHFTAFVQLRVRSYEAFQTMPLYHWLHTIAQRGNTAPDDEVVSWSGQILTKLDLLVRMRIRRTEQYPLLLSEPPYQSISLNSIRLRHVISLYQQGVAILDEVIRLLHAITSAHDYTVLTVFAIEPSLLREPPIGDAFTHEMEFIALSALENQADPAIKSNALLVLFYLEDFIVHRAGAIARECVRDPLLWAPWLSLCLAAYDGRRREAILEKSLESLRYLATRGSDERHVNRAMAVIQTAQREPFWTMPETEAAAKSSVYKLLREGRAHHGPGFGMWWGIHQMMVAIERAPQHVPGEKDLPEGAWQHAEMFLQRVIIPAMYGFAYLARGRPELDAASVVKSARRAHVAFQRAKSEAQRAPQQEPYGDLLRDWKEVRRWTLASSVDLLYLSNRDCLMGEAQKEGRGTLDLVLPDLVAEPFGLLLHAVAHRLSEDVRVSITVQDGEERHDGTGTIEWHLKWLETRWRKMTSTSLTVCWSRPDLLRRVYKLIADNIAVHGGTPLDLSITAVRRGNLLSIRVSNERRIGDMARSLSGLTTIRALTSDMGGKVTIAEPSDSPFWIEHTVMVSTLRLPAIGASEEVWK